MGEKEISKGYLPSTRDMWRISSVPDFTMQGVLVQKGHLGQSVCLWPLWWIGHGDYHYNPSEEKGEGGVEEHKEKRGKNLPWSLGVGTIKQTKNIMYSH